MLPPNPNFSVTQSPDRGHNRRSSHFRTGSRGSGSNTNTDGINSNWRAQQQSPQQQQRQGGLLEPPQVGFTPGHKPRNSSYGGGSSVSSLQTISSK